MTTKSGRPGSNRPPEAWKATALPNELLPLLLLLMLFQKTSFNLSGQWWIRTTEVEDSGFTVRSIWPLW